MIYEIFQTLAAIAIMFFLSWLFMHFSISILKFNSDREYNIKSSLIFALLVYLFHFFGWYIVFVALIMYFIIMLFYKESRLNTFKIWLLWSVMFIIAFFIFALLTSQIKPF